MSTAASPAVIPRTPASTRRNPSYDQRDRYQTTTSPRSVANGSPRRSVSQSQAQPHSRNASGQQQPQQLQQLQNVAHRDFEQTNVAQALPQHRSASQEGRPDYPVPARSDSTRHGAVRQGGHSRYDSHEERAMPHPPPTTANGDAEVPRPAHAAPPPGSSNGVRRRTTIDAVTGTWELGKTIGAGSMGKVKLARNRETGEQVAVKIVPRQSTDEHRSQAERERADHSKEVRTAREAAIVTLVDHPYICGMRDVVRTNYHWYMLFEYVNGGQMLDYIISHGRLKEKQARKFGRQIASALDYCHRNSIVHRDLKIENILISKTGDIKIIDFGLSNTFSPRSVLKTFCGSLYFAAPELLQAKAYVGPEVDVWSFGIVLYVLVCGKVPFDDQSMPQLHAKIKKGQVDYPPWLTSECKSLIARMLVTDPAGRAPLSEIMSHPWMTKGFGSAPENFVPPRKPLQLPLDPAVLQKMDGFDFGSADSIEAQLTKVLQTEEYQKAVVMTERRSQLLTPEVERRRGVFDFYKRRNSTNSRDTLTGPSSEAVQLGADPLNAYHPLISIYFLAKEKLEREQRESNPGALTMPHTPGEKSVAVPDLQAPQAAYTNTAAYEMAGEKTGGRSRPRARTHGEDEVLEDVRKINARQTVPTPQVVLPPPEQMPARKESAAAGLLRRFSTRRHREPERPSPGSTPAAEPYSTPRKSFSMRRTRGERENSTGGLRPDPAETPEMLTPPPLATDTLPVNRRAGLGRSTSVSAAEPRRNNRRGASEGANFIRQPMSPQASTGRDYMDRTGDAASSDAEGSGPRTGIASRTKSVGHARKESMQARRARRAGIVGTDDVPEETDQELERANHAVDPDSGAESPSGMKPVYLKGLFSVSTTSSKPLKYIRTDIIRTLRQLNVEFREIKGGFSCRHAPSIDIAHRPDNSGAAAAAADTDKSDMHREASHKRKISFAGFKTGTASSSNDPDAAQTPPTRSRRADTSTTNSEESVGPAEPTEGEEDEQQQQQGETPTQKPSVRRRRSSHHAGGMGGRDRPPGETSTHVQSDLGTSMALKFEIFVVKIPILGHGIQFKKLEGGTWQYKNMAQTILNELKL